MKQFWIGCLLLGIAGAGASPARGQDKPAGIDPSSFDRNVRIQDDLYRFVNGAWLNATQIPPDKSNYGAFTILADQSQERIKELIEELGKQAHPAGSDAQKVGDLYKSFMDDTRIESLGLRPLDSELRQIHEISDRQGVVDAFARLRILGAGGPIGFFVEQDDKDATRYLSAIIQSGTTLPDRDYYLVTDNPKFAAARTALVTYVATLLGAAGVMENERLANEILKLETDLAQAQWSRVELRDPEKRYNKYAVADLPQLGSNLDYTRFLQQLQVGAIQDLNVATPSFFEALDKQFAATPLEVWKAYLQFKLLDAYAPFLHRTLADAHFQLHDAALGGVTEQKPRWRRAVAAVAGEGAGDFGALGEVVGKLYVEKYFPPENKQRMEVLVKNLLQAFGNSIDDLSWMTAETKLRAREKLGKITTKIGYPNRWRDYSKLTIAADDLVGNLIRSNRVEYERMINKLGKPIDREEWGMTPQTVNAYYNPSQNEIVFPAAILQPPFFNPNADDAVNYGGIGAVIGHEISHAFDDQGSQYDGDGNLKNWWTEKDAQAFQELTQRLVEQYAAYEPLPGNRLNGQLTLGENIADLSGLAIAYKAYKLSLAGKPAPKLDGFSGDQRFFIGWSQVWRRKYRDDEMLKRIKTDPHSPSYFRSNGPVTNIDAFYEAFGVTEKDALFKPASERIRIW